MMSIAENKQLVERFVDAVNAQSIDDLAALLDPDFVWNTPVVGDDDPNELRPLQSDMLRGKNLPHAKPRLNRAEALSYFSGLFGQSSAPIFGPAGEKNWRLPEDNGRMTVEILGMTAEGDRVAVEARSTGVFNPENGRRYANFYHFLFVMKADRILLFKEYQDTLHIFDYLAG